MKTRDYTLMSTLSLTSLGGWAQAFGLGMVSGSRSMLAPALFSQSASRDYARALAGTAFAPLAWREVSLLLRLFSIGEIAIDKLPIVPDRIKPLPLLGRAVLGGIVGGASATVAKRSPLIGTLAGLTGAIVGAYAGYHMRTAAGNRGLPDPVVALVEDALAVGGGVALLRR